MSAAAFIATGWPDRIADAAAPAMELFGRRGPAPEDAEDPRFG